RWPSLEPVVGAPHGVAPGDGAAATDPGRSDAAPARGRAGHGVGLPSDPGEEGALLRRSRTEGPRPAAVDARARPALATAERPGSPSTQHDWNGEVAAAVTPAVED